MYLLLSSFISKRALGLPSSWEVRVVVQFAESDQGQSRRSAFMISACQALYFSVVTLTTIGLGDLVPQTPEAKWIISLLCLVGVPIFGPSKQI